MRRNLFIAFIYLLWSIPVLAQRNCASFEYEQQEIRNNPALAKEIGRIENFSKNFTREVISGTSGSGIAAPVVTIPVVVHILFHNSDQDISDAQVFSQIEILNRNFRRQHDDTLLTPIMFRDIAADCLIQFALANVDPFGRATNGIVRKQTGIQYFGTDDRIKYSNIGGDDAWDSDEYLNIWVGNTAGGIIGYSSVVGGPKDKDGIVIRYTAFGSGGKALAPYDRGRTAVHETGHWLGLRHIWGDTYCGNDYIDDTPPQRSSTFGCPTGATITCDNGPNGNMYMNYMDLTDDACTNMFTSGQKEKMLSLFGAGGPRNALLSSNGASGTPQPAPIPLPDSTEQQTSIHPNPAQDIIRVYTGNDGAMIGKEIVILNYLGQQLMKLRITQSTMIVNIGHLKEGVYFVLVGNRKRSYKIVRSNSAIFN